MHAWYQRNATLAACILRDAEYHVSTQEIIGIRIAPKIQAMHDVPGAGLAGEQTARLHLALNVFTWRTLIREGGMEPEVAVAMLVRAIPGAETH
jgi:hypothetical protein